MDERYLNVVDVEATCWEGAVPPGQVSEIIEIGLCVVDLQALERVGRRSIVVRPVRSVVSEFCTELTTLTQEQVDSGAEFAAACELLRSEHGAAARAWASWRDDDRRQFERQCAATGVPYPFGVRHINAKRVFSESLGTAKRYGMAEALRVREMALEGTHHRGGDDAWNIANLVVDTIRRGAWPDQESVDWRWTAS
ncbi:exonuclease domain-containing protein [Nocardia sp. CDC159]|uniref:Exonuclease domain-containing protein n=1 Tax=Nocardia pulmonis TaxID=2951408 RepID=A0A9X2E8B9_9NOCA|nr:MULTISPECIES: 3'-5' exonuclease [Nocardia]MCM6773323.1 exonuclease domain-containing protein [Nocardia pulmonis]MCM6786210.1 exonuclease domain-containing protein [Nocardia sp. CDC159]